MDFAQTLWAALAPVVMEALGIIALLAATWLLAQLKQRFGLEVTEKQRALLHQAIVTGLHAAFARGLSGDEALTAAVSHAQLSVPGAIKALKPLPGVLENIAASYAAPPAGVPK